MTTPKNKKESEKSVAPKKNGGARAGAGRKKFKPTADERKQVQAMSGYGVPFEQIRLLIRGGIDYDTMIKYFNDDLYKGKAKANSKVGQTIYSQATTGNTAAAIWWSKSQMGWKDQSRLEITGADGGDLKIDILDAKGKLQAMLDIE